MRKPYDVAIIDDSEAIVTCPNVKLLLLVSILPSLQLGRTISLDKDFWCVAVLNRQIQVACNTEDSTDVQILNLTGEILKTVVVKTPNPAVGLIRYIAVNPQGTKLYMTYSGGLLSTTVDGQILWTHSSPDFECGSGLTVDKDENAYVCCFKRNKIVKVCSDGTTCKVFKNVPDEFKWPKSIEYSDSDGVLIVGGFSSNLLVLKIK